jgi:hypothetical protein
MPDVIEAGANGMLPEALFSEVLRVNDAIAVTLEAEKVVHNSNYAYLIEI